MYENPTEVEDIRAGYETWRLANPETKNQHSQYYKRWMRQIQWPLNKPSDEYLAKSATGSASSSGNWTQQGPWHYDPEVAMYFEVQSPGACHVYTVEQAPSNPEVVYCGTATAGMYRSENKGLNWDLISGDLPVTGVYSIAISPSDADVIFLGSSNGNLYKSYNGGMTWDVCGNNAYQSSSRWYRTIMFHENGILAATNDGLWFSEDLGDSMQLIQAGEFMELERHPTDPSVIYTVKLQGSETIFMKSVDGGLSFSNSGVGSGWPTIDSGSEQKRTEISVSMAEPDAVYALAAGSTPDGGGTVWILCVT